MINFEINFTGHRIEGGKFMKAYGVSCVQTFDKMEQAKVRKETRFKELTIGERLLPMSE